MMAIRDAFKRLGWWLDDYVVAPLVMAWGYTILFASYVLIALFCIALAVTVTWPFWVMLGALIFWR